MVIIMHLVKVKTILSKDNGVNIYRGCLHGCIYCDSRSKCYQMKHDFEDIEVKENSLYLLEDALKRKTPCMIGTGAMSDPYNPLEKKLQYTKRMLELIEKYEFGVTLHTKSNLILRDIDIIDRINRKSKAVVQVTLTTYDEALCKKIEPYVSSTKERVEILKECKKRGIPTVVWLDPILPFINDTQKNLMGILNYCIENDVYGIICFGMGVTLREGSREYFYDKLDEYFPGMKERYETVYGNAYEVNSLNNKNLMNIFYTVCKQNNIKTNVDEIFKYLHDFPIKKNQLSIFDFLDE